MSVNYQSLFQVIYIIDPGREFTFPVLLIRRQRLNDSKFLSRAREIKTASFQSSSSFPDTPVTLQDRKEDLVFLKIAVFQKFIYKLVVWSYFSAETIL
jgi:hypothetical protein